VQLDLDPVVMRSLESTLKGAVVQAYAGAEFKQELHRTQAAQAAFNSRKRASRRAVKKGGPTYAEDARRMKLQRQKDDAEAAIQKHQKKLDNDMQKWKKKYTKLLPNLRRISKAWSKIYDQKGLYSGESRG
jgi:hypothetical protein